MKRTSDSSERLRLPVFALALVFLAAACALNRRVFVPQHSWWRGLGPVVPHESFPAECGTCHIGNTWQSIRKDFSFDHGTETGVELAGAHAQAKCLRCHNDRGPVETFAQRGCVGCHEDIHVGQLGNDCTSCHVETSWYPSGQIAMHNRTRFPLVGVHAATSCRRCHPGAEVGRFGHTDPECLTCHQRDLLNANNPNHIGLGWVDNCDRCHLPTDWNQAEVD